MINRSRVYFSNPGEIDMDAVRTMGVSVKTGTNPVGYFGTGLKFAISTIMRQGGKVTIWSGKDKHVLSTESKPIRGELFDVVVMDGQPMGFTTMLGRNWEPWMAYRELACNAFDEGGEVSTAKTKPAAGTTLIEVDCSAILNAHRDRDEYMIDPSSEPIVQGKKCSAYAVKTTADYLFYRGVRASAEAYRGLFRYNTLSDVPLTEDRTAKYVYKLADPIACMWLESNDKSLLRKVLTQGKGTIEHDLDWITCGAKPGAAWLEVVAEIGNDGGYLSPAAERAYEKAANKSANLPETSMALRPDQQQALNDSLAMLNRAGYSIKSPILVTDRLGPNILGRASNRKIYLSPEAFDMGDSTLAGTIIEEWIHIKKGFKDCERPMQNWLFDALISQIKRAEYSEMRKAA